MIIYEIEGRKFCVMEGMIHEVLALPDTSRSHEVVPPVTVTKMKKHKPVRKYVARKGYQRGTCGKCGKQGHNAWHCPDRETKKKGSGAQRMEPEEKKHIMSYEEARDEVVRLAKEDKSPLAVAGILKLRIRMVKKMWPKGLATPDEESEDSEDEQDSTT